VERYRSYKTVRDADVHIRAIYAVLADPCGLLLPAKRYREIEAAGLRDVERIELRHAGVSWVDLPPALDDLEWDP
jgi:hypothetical protein